MQALQSDFQTLQSSSNLTDKNFPSFKERDVAHNMDPSDSTTGAALPSSSLLPHRALTFAEIMKKYQKSLLQTPSRGMFSERGPLSTCFTNLQTE